MHCGVFLRCSVVSHIYYAATRYVRYNYVRRNVYAAVYTIYICAWYKVPTNIAYMDFQHHSGIVLCGVLSFYTRTYTY